MGAHGPGAAFWTPGVTLMGVGIGVVFHLVVPGLDVEGRRTEPAGYKHKQTHRQTNGRLSHRPSRYQGQKGNI